jgi:hypothetical protein
MMTAYLVSIRVTSKPVMGLLDALEDLGLLEINTVMDEETGEVE